MTSFPVSMTTWHPRHRLPRLDPLLPGEEALLREGLEEWLADPVTQVFLRRVAGLWTQAVSRLQASEVSTESLQMSSGRLAGLSSVLDLPEDLATLIADPESPTPEV